MTDTEKLNLLKQYLENDIVSAAAVRDVFANSHNYATAARYEEQRFTEVNILNMLKDEDFLIKMAGIYDEVKS